MAKIPNRPEEIFQELTDGLKAVYGDSLISVILFGSGARGEYRPKKSDLNFLIVLKDNSPSELAKCQKQLTKWYKRNVAIPLFLTEQYIQASLDTFPIEFLEMSSAYQLVWGKDVLSGLRSSKANLRLQCERELKGKLLHLRHAFLESQGKMKDLPALLSTSIAAFAPIFRALLYISDIEAPRKRADLIKQLYQSFHLDSSLFETLLQIVRKEKKASKTEAEYLFDKYVEEIDKLSQIVDRLVIEKEENR